TPTDPLAFDTFYEVALSTALTDRSGVHLATSHSARFHTESRPTAALTDIQPRRAPAGALVTLLGVGFDAAIPAGNRVAFKICASCPAETTQCQVVTPTSLVAAVPASAI